MRSRLVSSRSFRVLSGYARDKASELTVRWRAARRGGEPALLPLAFRPLAAFGERETDRPGLFERHATQSLFWRAEPAGDLAVPALRLGGPDGAGPAETIRTPEHRVIEFSNAYAIAPLGIAFDASGAAITEAAAALRWSNPSLSLALCVRQTEGGPAIDRRRMEVARPLAGIWLLAAHAGHANYGHWLTDCLGGVFAFRDALRAGHVKLLAPRLAPLQRATLDLLGVPPAARIELGRTLLRCERLLVPSYLGMAGMVAPSPVAGAIYDALRSRSCETPAARRIFILRGPALRRRLRNQAALADALHGRGFVAVDPATLSFAQQRTLFAAGEFVVGATGAGMANVGLAPPGCRIIEIQPSLMRDPWLRRLAARLGHRYESLVAPVAEADRRVERINDRVLDNTDFSFVVDPAAILRLVDAMLAGS